MHKNLFSKGILLQFFTFACVGGFATITHYLTAIVAVEYFNLVVYIANIVGYICAVCVSYFGHSLLTFKQKLAPATLTRFIVGSISTVLLSQGLLYILDSHFALHPRISMAVTVLYILFQSYAINKFWVYKTTSSEALD